MDDKTTRLIDDLIQGMGTVNLLRNSELTKERKEELREQMQRVELILEKLLQHLESMKEAK